MVQMSYWDEVFFEKLTAAFELKRLELLEGLARGVEYDEYLRQVGQINGLRIAGDLAKELQEKYRSST
jgi:hypothetical protein